VQNIADAAPVAIDVGTTTREDVLMLLGEPDAVAIDESWIAYTSAYTLGGVIILAGAGGGVGGVGGELMRYRRLIVEFDSQGRTTAVVFEYKRCSAFGAFGLSNNAKGIESKPCLDVRGLDIPDRLHLPALRNRASRTRSTVVSSSQRFRRTGIQGAAIANLVSRVHAPPR